MIRGLGRALTLVLVLSAPAFAQDAVKTEAHDRFDRGLRLFNDGDNAGALAEFKRAYELIANSLVLYNMGLVYAAMNRPVESVDALEKVLANPGPVAGDRLARAKQTRDEQSQRIAQITVATSVPAFIEVDGLTVGQTPREAPLPIAGGVHVIGAVASGYVPVRKEVTVAGGGKAEVRFDLVAMQGTAAHFTLETRLPGADVVVDDQLVGHTPLAQSMTVAPGKHAIELRRPGYRTARQDLMLGDGASATVTLEPEEDPSAMATQGGTLALTITEAQAVVTIDGTSRGVYTGSFVLARGVHRLHVERGGFEPIDREVVLDAGRTTTVKIALDPTPATRAAYVSKTSSQRTWGIVVTVAGAAITAGAIGFTIWNEMEKSTAQSDFDAAKTIYDQRTGVCDIAHGMDPQVCDAFVNTRQATLDNANQRAPFGYVGIGLGVATTAVGVILLLTNGDPHRYDRSAAKAAIRWITPTLSWDGRGATGLALGGAF